MAPADAAAAGSIPGPAWEARCLLRAARVASLATVGEEGPGLALVTPACLPDLSPLLLLSGLSAHTKALQRDPRCALLVAGAAEEANPQTAPRLSLACTAAPFADEAARALYLAVHPYAALYAGFGDFALWRLTILSGHFVAGFARAHRLAAADLHPAPEAVAAIAAAAAGVIAHCNDDHAGFLSRVAGGGGWRMVAVDPDGFDLAPDAGAQQAGRTRRIAFRSPAGSAGEIRTELMRLS